jgi:hypothetical protein
MTTQTTTPTPAMPTDTPILLLAELTAAAEHTPFSGGRPSLHALHTLPLKFRQYASLTAAHVPSTVNV